MASKDKKRKGHFFLKFFLFIIFIGVFIYVYGVYIEPKQMKVNEYKIVNDNINDDFNGFTIVHLSDIHYGNGFNLSDLERLARRINDVSPDIVVLSGDLIDKSVHMTTDMAGKIGDILGEIDALCGKYAIKGDEDSKFDEWDNIIGAAGFTPLNNSYDTIYKNGYEHIMVAGISSFSDKEAIVNKNQKNENYLNSFEKGGPLYKVLVLHEPDYVDELENNPYDLILAGHSLGGVINLPGWGPLINKSGSTKYNDGHYKIGGSDLYVSNGIGVSDIQFRLLNTPSFNVYRLIKK